MVKFFYLNITVPHTSEYQGKSILIVRPDAIGDYILFRNFIQVIKEHPLYADYKITLVGNIAWKSLAEEFDSQYIDKFIWIDRKKFNSKLNYMRSILTEISKKKYDIAIQPVFSREFHFGDLIIYFAKAYKKKGFAGDFSNIEYTKYLSDLFYSDLVSHKEKIKFEFERNKDFFNDLLKTHLKIEKPYMLSSTKRLEENNYAIIFIGSSHPSRRWSIQNYVQTAKFIQENWGLKIILCGGPSDTQDASDFEQSYTGDYKNLVGKISLAELTHIISNASLLLSNETGAVHIAAALQLKNIFVVSNGNHLKRFCPHPQLSSYHLILPAQVENNFEEYIDQSNRPGFAPPDINLISVEKCINSIVSKLSGLSNETL
jgi:ADP-heptose:LPS heptosyltransferase